MREKIIFPACIPDAPFHVIIFRHNGNAENGDFPLIGIIKT